MPQKFKQLTSNLNLKDYYIWLKENGVGYTPLTRLPKQINPYDKEIPIYAKIEYVNFGESIKARAFATMYYLNRINGKLNNKPKAIAATSGNFGLAASYILNGKYSFTVNMSEKGAKENTDLASKLRSNGTKIETFPDGYCPTVGAKRGEAIAAARFVEKIDDAVVNYDQYDDWANPLAHYLTTGPEIHSQTQGKSTHFVTSLGTCATMIGTGTYLKEVNPKINLIGLYPQDNHHQLGLRSRDELGATKFYEDTKNLCQSQIEVSDENAFNTMVDLWNNNVPSGISSGANIWGALQTAKKLHENHEEGLIVTTLPDSCENYRAFLESHFWDVTGKAFEDAVKTLETAATKALEARKEHIATLKAGGNSLFVSLTK
jgi:cysteine synthase B